jgi:hypothetical protein
MTPEEYRRIALAFPGTEENSHMDHPDFRVRGKIFATLWKDNGVVILTREQQEQMMRSNPDVFAPAKGGWGRKGSTTVLLKTADQRSVREALSLAWSNKAAKPRERPPRKSSIARK